MAAIFREPQFLGDMYSVLDKWTNIKVKIFIHVNVIPQIHSIIKTVLKL